MENKLVVRRWVDALRSDEYKQCQGGLAQEGQNGIEYCCLGVLCELAVSDGVIAAKTINNGCFGYESTSGWQAALPPLMVAGWVGLVGDSWEVEEENTNVELTSLNDDRNWTFAEIADVIEENFLR